ncbi:MAG: hypothetical protein M1831_006358 [Alyxoria varia]|nr:MAG: hypothetical protein M1831_006358 [Alyxoria varia]
MMGNIKTPLPPAKGRGGLLRSLAIVCSIALLAPLGTEGKAVDCKEDVKAPSPQNVKRVESCTPTSAPTPGKPYFATCDPTFHTILGANPSFTLARNDSTPYYHEAGVYIPSQDALFVTSNQYVPPDGSTSGNKTIVISKLVRSAHGPVPAINKHAGHWSRETIHPTPDIPLANGGVNYDNGVLFCAQGDTSGRPSALTHMTTSPPYKATTLLDSFDGQREFNSPNDVVVLPKDGSIWFTDPSYGFEQGVRPQTELPNRVYRFDPADKSVKVVAEGFVKPNGIAFSPDFKTVYVTDTGRSSGDGVEHPELPAAIYAFDRIGSTLQNRRLFARPSTGIPDGIKLDTRGNLYAGCGDGVNVWGPKGKLLGKMVVPEDGIANFAFGRSGEVFLLNERRFWVVRVDGGVSGALLGEV